jgi:hypothetical protein
VKINGIVALIIAGVMALASFLLVVFRRHLAVALRDLGTEPAKNLPSPVAGSSH